jgi:hypothetical protein
MAAAHAVSTYTHTHTEQTHETQHVHTHTPVWRGSACEWMDRWAGGCTSKTAWTHLLTHAYCTDTCTRTHTHAHTHTAHARTRTHTRTGWTGLDFRDVDGTDGIRCTGNRGRSEHTYALHARTHAHARTYRALGCAVVVSRPWMDLT